MIRKLIINNRDIEILNSTKFVYSFEQFIQRKHNFWLAGWLAGWLGRWFHRKYIDWCKFNDSI